MGKAIPLDYATVPPRAQWKRLLRAAWSPRGRRVILRIGMCLLALAIAGYVSADRSREACRTRTARHLGVPVAGSPIASIGRAEVSGPFFVEVEYGIVAAPLVGEWGRRRYLCFFGLIFDLGARITAVS